MNEFASIARYEESTGHLERNTIAEGKSYKSFQLM